MAIRSLTYHNIPVTKRHESAARALTRLRERLGDATLTVEQAQQLQAQVARLEGWISGTINPKPGA